MSHTKNSVKLLKTIGQFENKLVVYTEFDGRYEVGDKLYIMVLDSGSTEYVLDSFQYSSSTYSTIGYELLQKDGNKLTIDRDISGLPIGLTSLTEGNCYIGRTYIKSGSVSNGVIYGTLLYDVVLEPKNNLSLTWYQGILVKSSENVTNINFNTNSTGQLILKSEVNTDGSINSYYTVNNYNNGLSIVNLSDTTLLLYKCNVLSGVFNNCNLDGNQNTVDNGILNDCYIGRTYVVNGGEFVNCVLHSLVTWNYGKWRSDWDGIGTVPFGPSTWKDGVWINGIFPYPRSWHNGRFLKGIFKGKIWNNGSFGLNNSISEEVYADTVFSGSSWKDGSFNGGVMISSGWDNGFFYNGLMKNTQWNDGNFNGGVISGTTLTNSKWYGGVFNGGSMYKTTWYGGTCNGGSIYDSEWRNGVFNNGSMKDTNWLNGTFYNGKMEGGIWYDGRFHKGSMFSTKWMDGNLYFGLMNFVNWSGGTWHNGIANGITFSGGTWKDGVFNFGSFNYGIWLNGSFNSGFFSGSSSFWKGGNFYFGEFAGQWLGGTFHTGRYQTPIPQKDIINREFYQYNKAGLVSNRYRTVRLPAKKKY
jgi:hypothetical protein